MEISAFCVIYVKFNNERNVQNMQSWIKQIEKKVENKLERKKLQVSIENERKYGNKKVIPDALQSLLTVRLVLVRLG